MKQRYYHIVFCGIDGSGKSTWAKAVSEELKRRGEKVNYIHGHSYTFSTNSLGVTGEKIHSIAKWLKAFWPLALLDNLYTYRVKYRPVLQHSHLITDRYFYDKLVRLSYYGILPKIFISLYITLLPRPTHIFFLDVDSAIAFKRKPDFSVAEYNKIREGYRFVASLLNVPIVDTSGPKATCRKEIFRSVWQ